jgi:hypothetical protein
VCRHKASGLPRISIKKIHIHTLQLEKDNSYLSSSIALFDMCYVLFSYACILKGQIYIFIVPPFREATFCGVPSCVFEKSGCAAGEKVCGTLV